jgi:hypothetical protein
MAFKMNKNKPGSLYQKAVYKNSTSFKLRTEGEDRTLEDIQASKAAAQKRLELIGIKKPLSDFSPEEQTSLQNLARKAAQGGGMNEAAINAAKSKILNPTREKGEVKE